MIVLRATRRLDPWLLLRGALVLSAVALADLAVMLTVWWETHQPASDLGGYGIRFTHQEARGSFGGIPDAPLYVGTDKLWDRVALLGTLALLALALCFLLRQRRELTRRNLLGLAASSAVLVLALLPFSGFAFRHLVGSLGWFAYAS